MYISQTQDAGKKDSKSKRWIDFFLFLVLSLLFPLFTLGRFTKETIEGYGYPTEKFGEWYYYPGLTPPLSFSIVLYIVFLLLALLLIYRRRDQLKTNRWIRARYIFFRIITVVSFFFYPKGEQTYLFTARNQRTYTIHTKGLTRSMRFVAFFNQFFFYSYICLFFHIVKPLTKENRMGFNLISIGIHILVLSMIFYAIIKQKAEILGNLDRIFNRADSFFREIKSYTTGRNVFGFFLFIAYLFAVSDFMRKENIVSILLAAFYIAFRIIIISKTPALLSLTRSLCCTIAYPILNFKKKTGWSVFFLCRLVFIVLLIRFGLLLVPALMNYIVKRFTQMGTRYSRYEITTLSFTRFEKSAFFSLFGYGRYPFAAVFTDYSSQALAFAYETSHDSFIDVFLHFGSTGAFLLVASYILLACYLLKRLFKEKKKSTVMFILSYVARSIYSFSEPRALFLRQGASLFVLLSFSRIFLDDAAIQYQSTVHLKKKLLHKIES